MLLILLLMLFSRGAVEDRVGRSQPGQSFLARQRQQTQQRRNQTRSVHHSGRNKKGTSGSGNSTSGSTNSGGPRGGTGDQGGLFRHF